VWGWATEALVDLGITRPRVMRRLDGIQGTILIVAGASDSPLRYAIKVFNSRLASNELLAREVAALEVFHGALGDKDDLGCPKPMASSAELCCYLMTYEAGGPIERALRGRPLAAYKEVAERVVAGLMLFHGSVGDIYGDFHPGNVLVARGERVIFLDPGIPKVDNPTFARLADELRFSPGSVDLGYWTFTVASRMARLAIARPPAALRRWRFTEELLPLAAHRMAPAHEEQAFLLEVLRAARDYLAWMRSNTGGRGPALSAIGGLGARRLVRRSLQHLVA
jgi:hypothetical protein